MEKFKALLGTYPWLGYVLVLVAGVALGALFYPTSHIEERLKSEYEQTIAQEKNTHAVEMKNLTDKYEKEVAERKTLEVETSKKITSLTIQVRDLKSKTKESYYKIVKPDGTIEIRKFKESEVDESTKVIASVKEEFDTKIKEINDRYEKVHRERVLAIKNEFDEKEKNYQQTISKLEKEKITDINPRKGSLELGYLSNRYMYIHTTYDLFGPVFLGVQTQYNPTDVGFAAGGSIGFRF